MIWTEIIRLHAQPQVVYCNFVKFHQYQFNTKHLDRRTDGDSYKAPPEKTLFAAISQKLIIALTLAPFYELSNSLHAK